jgi:hypothetical protein
VRLNCVPAGFDAAHVGFGFTDVIGNGRSNARIGVAFASFLYGVRLSVRVRNPVGDAPNAQVRMPENGCSSQSLPERNYLTSSAADFGANNSA